MLCRLSMIDLKGYFVYLKKRPITILHLSHIYNVLNYETCCQNYHFISQKSHTMYHSRNIYSHCIFLFLFASKITLVKNIKYIVNLSIKYLLQYTTLNHCISTINITQLLIQLYLITQC